MLKLEQSTTPSLVTEGSIDNSAQREQERSGGVHERANSIREKKYEESQKASELFGRAALYTRRNPRISAPRVPIRQAPHQLSGTDTLPQSCAEQGRIELQWPCSCEMNQRCMYSCEI